VEGRGGGKGVGGWGNVKRNSNWRGVK
jgi:hypothetical protein